MRLRAAHEDALLTGEETAMIRQALAACAKVLTWAGQHGSLQLETVVAEAAEATGRSGEVRGPPADAEDEDQQPRLRQLGDQTF